ncbi:hypothetical protein MUN88_17050 [Gracilibacillus caseinilyticus]|uniref:Uncharacterized protein n=1 Tax=Gracilibacillus caseinilyticus TaxID=2932256 RepID=A0ABY4ETJ1_9BACI|nr:hypothetical protein [Gracilibacillus caseinilyticus]UOQ47740.1 hypothetical protein MUN88_17050 [Gracilibacillus caseinilyticus]
MRLTKTMYVIDKSEREVIDLDPLGNPIYGEGEIIYHPIRCEIEPYSSELARTRLGLTVDVTHRAFCYPNDLLKLNVPIKYDGSGNYKITELLRYDKHYEVLIKKG